VNPTDFGHAHDLSSADGENVLGLKTCFTMPLKNESIMSQLDDECLLASQQVLIARSTGTEDLPTYLHALARALRARYEQLWLLEDLKRMISLYREAVDLLKTTRTARNLFLSPLEISCRSSLCRALADRCQRTVHGGDIEDLIMYAIQLQDVFSVATAYVSEALLALGVGLRTRFEYFGNANDLDRATRIHRDACDVSANGHTLANVKAELGITLCAVYLVSGDSRDFEEAQRCLEHALNLPGIEPIRKEQTIRCLGNLANIVYRHSGKYQDAITSLNYAKLL
jgi:tetratricopeptide (TPR) repeat protein